MRRSTSRREHNNPSRDGVYIDAAFTPAAAANLTRDLNFNGTISGNVHAQPLYIEGGPNGPMIIAVTESNNVHALNATTGLPIWSRTDIGPPVTKHPVRRFFSHWYHWHAGCRSRLSSAFLRRIDQRLPHKTFHLFVERGHRRHHCGLAGGSERHRHLQRNSIHFSGAGTTRWTRSGERDRILVLLRLRGRLRQLSWLGCRRGHQQPYQCAWLGDNSHGRRYLGPRRRCQRWHKHVCRHREHLQYRRQLDGR